MPEPLTVPCQECSLELAADSPPVRLELTCDDESLVCCLECWEGSSVSLPSGVREGGSAEAGRLVGVVTGKNVE
jgi:hypothetical protein